MRRSSWRKGKHLLLITACLVSAACGSSSTRSRLPPLRGASSALGAGTPTLSTVAASTATTRATTPTSLASPSAGQCPIFPADNIWNQNISQLPVDPHSSQYIASIGASGFLHPDFGSNPAYGIPYNVVTGTRLQRYQSASSMPMKATRGPYPIPARPAIEAGSDRHLLIVDTNNCHLYELYDAVHNANGSWQAGSGAIWDLRSNALRPAGWTSADAAGLPIFPGLVRYDEVASGSIDHALRFTIVLTRDSYIWPARHEASNSSNPDYPPMGLRLRLKASVDISGFPPQDQVILRALKTYGMIVADNGSNWYISGASDSRWNDDALNQLKTIPGSDFEVVDTSSLMVNPNSGQA